MRIRLILQAGALLLALGLARAELRADDGIPVPADTPESAAGLLGQDYKDEASGFRMQLPFGVRVFQRAGLELVSFVHDTKQWAGNVQLVTLEKDMNVETLLRSRSGDLAKVFKAVQILESREALISGKPAGKLVSALEADYPVAIGKDGKPVGRSQSIPLLRQELMVQTATNQYMVLTFFAPLAQKPDAIRIFDAMMGTFELLDRKAVEARRLAAVQAGQEWMAPLRAENLTSRLVREPQYFRIKIENREVGYLRIDEIADATRDGFKGILVLANSRTFPADGSLILGSNEAFWAYHDQGRLGDLPSYSTWDNRAGTQVPSDPLHPAAPRVKTSEIPKGVVLHGVAELPPAGIVKWTEEIGTLQMSLHPDTTNKNQIEFKPVYDLNISIMADREDIFSAAHNKPLHWTIDAKLPSPLPKPLDYLWPRLVNLNKESQVAVVVFNSGQSHLGLRTLSVGKKETVSIDAVALHLTRLTDELAASSTTLWVDDKGVIKMMRTSDGSVLLPTTEEKLQQMWSAKLARFK